MIEFKHVTCTYGEKTPIRDLTLALPDAGVIGVFGASGSGKTTLLRLLAGRIRPASGTVTGLAGKRVSMVFQEDRLLPWRTALENVALVREGSEADARDLLSALGLASEADQLPAALSGSASLYGGGIFDSAAEYSAVDMRTQNLSDGTVIGDVTYTAGLEAQQYVPTACALLEDRLAENYQTKALFAVADTPEQVSAAQNAGILNYILFPQKDT